MFTFIVVLVVVGIQIWWRLRAARTLERFKDRFPQAQVFGSPTDALLRQNISALAASYGQPEVTMSRVDSPIVVADHARLMVFTGGPDSQPVLSVPSADVINVIAGKSNEGVFSLPRLTFVVERPTGKLGLTAIVRGATASSLEAMRNAILDR